MLTLCSCDIEQEVNGLYSIHRKEKIPSERVRAIMDAAREYYYKNVLAQRTHLGSKVMHSLEKRFHM